MSTKKKAIIAVSVLLAVLLVAGITAVAVTNYGTQNDPLVTLSYLNGTAKTEIMAEVDKAIEEAKSELGASSSEFTVVTLSNGQKLTCSAGTEIMLRVGSAVSAGSSSPTLVDSTTGEAVSNAGTALVKNHMYLVTIKDNGIKATAATTKVLVCGSYTVG